MEGKHGKGDERRCKRDNLGRRSGEGLQKEKVG